MGQELVLPDWANQRPASGFAALNPAEDSLSDGIGQSYPVIGYKGKVWSFRARGERKNFIRPDDGTPAAFLDVIILGQAKQKSKSFYKKFDPTQSEGDRPICSSIDGVRPDPDATTKQCDTCALCPRNEWKVNPETGKKGRECADYKRLAVLVLPTQTQPLYGQPVLEPAFLRVPAGSLNSLAIMGDTMAGKGFHYAAYITRITFDPNESHPKMVFRPLQGLTDNEAPMIMKMRGDMNVDRIINGGFADSAHALPSQGSATLLPPGAVTTGLTLDVTANPSTAAPLGAAQQGATPGPGSGQTTAFTSLVSAPPATNSGLTTQPAGAPPSGTPTGLEGLSAPTGFGIVPPAGTAPEITPQPTAIIGDTGAPEATDDDLDAQIAGMIAKSKSN